MAKTKKPEAMTIGHALLEAAALQRKADELWSRANENARFQEGEEPEADSEKLVLEAEATIVKLYDLRRRVTATNVATVVDGKGTTLLALLLERERLRKLEAGLRGCARSAEGGRRYDYRTTKSELKWVTKVKVTAMTARADAAAKEIRDLTVRIEQLDWSTHLVD